MRASFATLLLLASCLIAHYVQAQGQVNPANKTNAAATAGAPRTVRRYTSQLGPAPNQRRVKLEQVLQKPARYAATLPVLRDKEGIITLSVAINTQTHSVQELKVLFAPLDKNVTYKQIGEGISLYDAPSGRYYFNTLYYKVQQFPTGVTKYGASHQIKGWIEPGTSQAAVAEGAVPHEAQKSGQSFLVPAN